MYHKEAQRIRVLGPDVTIADRGDTEIEICQGSKAIQRKSFPACCLWFHDQADNVFRM